MFYNCHSLTSLDLSSFDTSLVNDMDEMFYNCYSLTSLDLSSFDTSLVKDMDEMFRNCQKLEYINLENSKMNAYYHSNIFYSTHSELIVCSKHRKWNDLLNGIENINCHNLYSSLQENQFKCYQKNAINSKSNKENICARCGPNYYKIYNDSNNNLTYFHCYKELEGYYLDKNELIYKECYYTCKKCDKEGNETFHNCLECNNEHKLEIIISNNSNNINCYNICANYYYYDYIMNKT